MRDLMHALDDLKDQRERAFRRCEALLCRHGIVWDARTRTGRLKKSWGREYWEWLRKTRLPDAISQEPDPSVFLIDYGLFWESVRLCA